MRPESDDEARWYFDVLVTELLERGWPVLWIVAGCKTDNEVSIGIVRPYGFSGAILDISLYALIDQLPAVPAMIDRLEAELDR